MLPGDRLICAFVENRPVGVQFKHWFLHVTIVPWFRLEEPSDVIAQGLSRSLKSIRPFEAVADGEARFRSRQNSPVTLLQQPTPFTEIEQKVRAYFHKKRALLVDETTKKHYEFRPHVTAQGDEGLKFGDMFWCDRLYIVEQKGDYQQSRLDSYDTLEIPDSSLAPAEPARLPRAGSRPQLDSFVLHGNYKEIVSEVCFG